MTLLLICLSEPLLSGDLTSGTASTRPFWSGPAKGYLPHSADCRCLSLAWLSCRAAIMMMMMMMIMQRLAPLTSLVNEEKNHPAGSVF